MSNRTELRDRLRVELGDEGTIKVWSDALLDDLLVQAGDWYSRLFPAQSTAYRDVTEGQRAFNVPAGLFSVVQVECPQGRVLPQEASGTVGAPAGSAQRQSWSIWGEKLYLANPAVGDEVGASKLVARVLQPWARLDPDVQWNGPEDDERLLVLWSATEAWAWLDGQDQKRGRAGRAWPMAARSAEQLKSEIKARGQAATSRRLEVG